MICKNCSIDLTAAYNYCPECGAKVIRNRLTFKNLWADLMNTFFNYDNTFLRTFKHLFTQPEVVVGGYIDGVRKKYMNPISYFTLAVTLSGFMFFILRKVYDLNLSANNPYNNLKLDALNLDKIYDYQGFLSFIILPIYALITLLIFIDKKKYNYTEHLILNSYVVSQYSFVQVVLSLLLFGLTSINFLLFNNVFLFFTIVYLFYVLKRLHTINMASTLVRGLIYIFCVLVLYMGIGILMFIILMAVNDVGMQDLIRNSR